MVMEAPLSLSFTHTHKHTHTCVQFTAAFWRSAASASLSLSPMKRVVIVSLSLSPRLRPLFFAAKALEFMGDNRQGYHVSSGKEFWGEK